VLVLRARSALALAAVLAVVGGGATGCADGEPTTQPSPTTASPSTPTVAVPSGVTLTEPGTALALGDSASAVYADGERATVLTVRVTKAVAGSTKDFKGFVLTRKERATTPYYVSARITNDGPGALGQTTVPLYGLDSTDTVFPATALVGAFDRCSGGPLPTGFAPHDSITTCLVYLVPDGATLEAVQLRTPDGASPISWDLG